MQVITKKESSDIINAIKTAYAKSEAVIEAIPAYKRNKKNFQGHSRVAMVETELANIFPNRRELNPIRNYEYTIFYLSSSIRFTVEHIVDVKNNPRHTLYKNQLAQYFTPNMFSEEYLDTLTEFPQGNYAYLLHSGVRSLEDVLLKSCNNSFEPIMLYSCLPNEPEKRVIPPADDEFEPVSPAVEKKA